MSWIRYKYNFSGLESGLRIPGLPGNGFNPALYRAERYPEHILLQRCPGTLSQTMAVQCQFYPLIRHSALCGVLSTMEVTIKKRVLVFQAAITTTKGTGLP